jgi:hypothetical protein
MISSVSNHNTFVFDCRQNLRPDRQGKKNEKKAFHFMKLGY